jgi:hypothetical protein
MDMLAPFRNVISLLEGKTVSDLPAEFRDPLIAAGFTPQRDVLSIPTIDQVENCLPKLPPQGLA